MTYYGVLGVEPGAPPAAIRDAYLSLARQSHPDYFTTASPEARAAAERRMVALNEAWSVLGDPGRRAEYDLAHDFAAASFAPFQAFDPDVDEPDPLDLPDQPYRPEPTFRPRLSLVPIMAFAASACLLAVWFVVGSNAVLGAATLMFVLSCLGLVMLLLLSLVRASHDEG